MPTDCTELNLLGHWLNGFYSVLKSKDSQEIQTIFCDFTQEPARMILIHLTYINKYFFDFSSTM